jgi:hypothetical protein
MAQCSYCHARLLPGAKFCIKCGRPVQQVPVSPQPVQQPVSPLQPAPPRKPVSPQRPVPPRRPSVPKRLSGSSGKHTGRTIAWIIVAIVAVIVLVVCGVLVYNHHVSTASAAHKRPKAVISDNVIVYRSAGDALSKPVVSISGSSHTRSHTSHYASNHASGSSRTSGESSQRDYPEILSLSAAGARVRAPEKPRVGQIMSAAASKTVPHGLLRKITKVTPSAKGKNVYDVSTKSASLTQAVKKADQTSKVVLPVTSDQITPLPAAGQFDDLDLKSFVPTKDTLGEMYPMLTLHADANEGFPSREDYTKASRNITDKLAFSAGQKQKYGFATTGSHEVSVHLKVIDKKVTLVVTDHIKAGILDRYSAGSQAIISGLVYYFNKPMTVMVGRMPLTLTPSLVMTTLAGSGDDFGGDAKLITNIDHTIGAKYQTGKPIVAIDSDASALGQNTYSYSVEPEDGADVPLINYSYKKMDAKDFAAFLSRFEINGFTVETGILDWQDTNGKVQVIPAGDNTSGAFTLPGISGKLRGSLTPHSQILSSVAGGTDDKLSGLDGSQPIQIKNLKKNKVILKKPTLRNGKVYDLPWLSNTFQGQMGRFSKTSLAVSSNGYFNAYFDGQSDEEDKEPHRVCIAHGRFILPADASDNKPFMMHLKDFVYEHAPDRSLYTDSYGEKVYATYCDGIDVDVSQGIDSNAKPVRITDYMYYPKGTPMSQLPEKAKQSYTLGWGGDFYQRNGKLIVPVIAGIKDGKVEFVFVDEKDADILNGEE